MARMPTATHCRRRCHNDPHYRAAVELVVTFLAAADGKLERFDRSDRLQEKLAVLEPVQAVAGLIGLLLLSGVTIFAGFLLRLGRPGIPAWAGTRLRRYPAAQ